MSIGSQAAQGAALLKTSTKPCCKTVIYYRRKNTNEHNCSAQKMFVSKYKPLSKNLLTNLFSDAPKSYAGMVSQHSQHMVLSKSKCKLEKINSLR